MEGFDWDAPVTFDRDRVKDLFSLGFLERHEDALLLGPVGVGKTFLASALGHAACRAEVVQELVETNMSDSLVHG